MVNQVIILKLTEGSEELVKSFTYSAIGRNRNLFVGLDGRYDNKIAVSNVSDHNWSITHKNLVDVLNEKGVSKKDIATITDILDNNGHTILTAIGADEEKKEEEKEKTEFEKILEVVSPLFDSTFEDKFHNTYAVATQTRIQKPSGEGDEGEKESYRYREILSTNKGETYQFENWVNKTYFQSTGRTIGSELLSQISRYFCAKAKEYDETKLLEVRLGKEESGDPLVYYYDLVNRKREVIKISKYGWTILDSFNAPTMFKRFSNQGEQVYPTAPKKYDPDIFDQFFKLVNVEETDTELILLLKCYIISLFIPGISKVILILHGPQGAAKWAFEFLIKLLIDPDGGSISKITLLSPPKEHDRFVQQASHRYATFYDNISYIKGWLSDDFCRAATGGGDSKRTLYTNDDEVIYQFNRCIAINGINQVANRADFLDRSIQVAIKRLDPEKVKKFDDIISEFQRIKPSLMSTFFIG